MAAPLHVELTPRDISCTAELAFAADYPILNCTFNYAKEDTVNTFASRIDETMRIKERGQIVDIGPLEFSFERKSRLRELALTVGANWTRDHLTPEPPNAPKVFLSFVADFDLDGRFASRMEAEAIFDESRQQLEVRMMPTIWPVIWHSLADRVLVTSSASGQFAGLRFLGLEAIPR